MGSTDDRRPHVALLAFPFGGHAAPLHAIARHLAGSSPANFFSFFCTARCNAPLASVPSPANLRLYDVPEGYVTSATNPEEEIDLFSKVAPGNFRDGMEVAARDWGARVTCVVADGFLWFAGKMAADVGAPWVAVWTSGACSLSAHVHTDDIRRAVGAGDQDVLEHGDRSLHFIPGLSDFRVRDLPEGVVFGNLNSAFSTLLHKIGRETPNATAVVINSFQGLEHRAVDHLRTRFKTCLPVGSLNLLCPLSSPNQDPFHCLSWLDSRVPTSVAYIAFGSMAVPSEGELLELARALEVSKVPFIWSLKERFVHRLPAGFRERMRSQGLVVSWAPQVDVLCHAAVGVFLTHCGWNSVTESIYGGVPMLCRPFFGDHNLNARAASQMWKIGMVAEAGVLTERWVVEALDVVLNTEEGKKMRERVASLREIAKNALGPSGSSIKNLDALSRICEQSI